MNKFVAGQGIFNNNAIYLEAGGAGLFSSLNYDFRFHDYGDGGSFTDGSGLRFGIAASPRYDLNLYNKVVAIGGMKPLFLVGLNTLSIQKYGVNSNIEAGVNFLLATKNSIADRWGDFKQTNRIIPSLNLGYRQQDIYESDFMWRICYTPYFLDSKVHHWLGISVGYVFIQNSLRKKTK